jgi:ribose transport system substrate-binding protein
VTSHTTAVSCNSPTFLAAVACVASASSSVAPEAEHRDPPSGTAKARVAFVSNNRADFWTIAEAGCRKGEKEFDVEVLFRTPDPGDQARQTEILDTLRNQKVKAIAVSVIDPNGQREHLDEIAAKIQLITGQRRANARKCYIGTNNYKAGRTVGQLVRRPCPAAPSYCSSATSTLNARRACWGVLDELEGKPERRPQRPAAAAHDRDEIRRVHPRDHVHRPAPGRDEAKQNPPALQPAQGPRQTLLRRSVGVQPARDPDRPGRQIKNGVIKEGQVKVVGFDENLQTLDGIADGRVHATVVQDPFGFGYESVRIMAGLAKGDESVLPPKGILDVPARVITKEGGKDRIPVTEFKEQLNKLLGR